MPYIALAACHFFGLDHLVIPISSDVACFVPASHADVAHTRAH